MMPVNLIGNILLNDYKEALYDQIKKYVESFCLANNINKDRQEYMVMFTPEEYLENQEYKYKVGFKKSLCFYGKLYLSPTSKELFTTEKHEYIFYPQTGDIIVAFGNMTNRTITDKKAETVEFYVGSSSSLRAFEEDSWMPI